MNPTQKAREQCTEQYPDINEVPWQTCQRCIAKSICGKAKPDDGESDYD
jgi:hypothetical protein